MDVLLDFCQNSLGYETDQGQFGKERYLFAEESLYYPFCDCEDRTILLSALVKRYTGLSPVALDFPGHVALAVHFQEKEEGTYITYKGKNIWYATLLILMQKAGRCLINTWTKNRK